MDAEGRQKKALPLQNDDFSENETALLPWGGDKGVRSNPLFIVQY